MLDDFVVRATLAALGTAIAAGLLGCFVLWRRMAYFGDAMAHAAVLGVALSLALSLSIFVGVGLIAAAMAWLFLGLRRTGQTQDASLGVLAHSALALGLVAVALLPGARINLDAYLFGDVLAVGRTDLAVIWGGALAVVGLVVLRWQAMLTATLSPDLAHASGIDPAWEERVLTWAMAAVVAVAIKVVGALLITALLIIPAATARTFGRTPEAMAVASVAIACLAALGGVQAALLFDTPVGPSIVVCAAVLFSAATLGGQLRTFGK